MRVVVDERTGPSVARWLESMGHDVVSIYDEAPRLPDEDILAFAVRNDRVVITSDKDFGDIVYRESQQHRGIIFLRLADNTVAAKVAALDRFFQQPPEDISRCFVVVTERGIRVGRGHR
jgi:predicted nuclease of predicted toxin-antitoxin system